MAALLFVPDSRKNSLSRKNVAGACLNQSVRPSSASTERSGPSVRPALVLEGPGRPVRTGRPGRTSPAPRQLFSPARDPYPDLRASYSMGFISYTPNFLGINAISLN